MSEPRTFPTLDVLSVTTGIMLSQQGIGGVYEVLDYLLDDKLMTHQLPAAATAATPEIYRQHPWIEHIAPVMGDLEGLAIWSADILAEYGETVELSPAPDAPWRRGNALQDIVDLASGRPVLGVVVDGDAS